MDLATIKEEHQIAPSALISHVFAPRYLTRSRASSASKEEILKAPEESGKSFSSLDDIHTNPPSVGIRPDFQKPDRPSTPVATPSEWETASDTPTNLRASARPYSPVSPIGHLSSTTAASASRKRGRHKDYTAPTGVWKTNGGYISTIYVGNRRIYGPLRDNPEEAGADRQRLIEAKSFAKTEAEMRGYIATLKGVSSFVKLDAPVNQPVPITTEDHRQLLKKQKPLLTTITSGPTTIEAEDNRYVMKHDDVLPPTY
jgi:hypothetical protein